MALTKYRLGDLIDPYLQQCDIPDLTPNDVSGVNREKEFFEPSKQVGYNTSKYKIVSPNHFACNLMHVGRDEVLPIALNHSSSIKYVSPAYSVFKIRKDITLLRDYLFMMMKSDELDRYFWFHTDSSVRDGMSWDDFCDIELSLPPLSVQQKYVDIYNAMVANQQCYERGLSDLKLVCDAYIENLRRTTPTQPIGQYITRTDIRNVNNTIKNVMGISTSKEFRIPTSKVNRDELASYKVVSPRQIAFVQTTHNEKLFAYAYNNTSKDIVVSSVNEVFYCDERSLIPEYLAMFFNRKEFDRYARFHSWGSARETFTWNDLVDVSIPIPDLSIQQSIANIYNVYTTRKKLNERLKAQIKSLCPILIKGSLDEASA